MSRWVLRAEGAARSGSRSVKMRRAQEAARHTNLRTVRWRRTASGPWGGQPGGAGSDYARRTTGRHRGDSTTSGRW